jgi:hypothetical protein
VLAAGLGRKEGGISHALIFPLRWIGYGHSYHAFPAYWGIRLGYVRCALCSLIISKIFKVRTLGKSLIARPYLVTSEVNTRLAHLG